jgi:hypothetical protein
MGFWFHVTYLCRILMSVCVHEKQSECESKCSDLALDDHYLENSRKIHK